MARTGLLLTFLVAMSLLSPACAAPISVPATTALPGDGLYLTSTGAPRNPSPTVPVVWELFASVPVVAVHLTPIPGTDDIFYVSRHATSLGNAQVDTRTDRIAMRVSLTDKSMVNVNAESNAFCAGHTYTADGDIVVLGGSPASFVYPDGGPKIRVFNAERNRFPDVGTMHDHRWYPTGTLMTNRKLFIIGGTFDDKDDSRPSLTYEIWNPARPRQMPARFVVEVQHRIFAGKHYYPFNYLLPTSHLFTFVDGRSRFLTQAGAYVRTARGGYLEAPEMPGGLDTNYPRSGTSVMLGVRYNARSVEVLVMGGQKKGYTCPADAKTVHAQPASRNSYRLTISWTYNDNGDVVYDFSDWVEEDMGLHRVGGDSTLLPNGDVVLTSGVQTGCMGDPKYNIIKGDYGQHWPALYQPDRRVNRRWTIMQASTILRSYHSNAVLTRNGTILISGCDICRPEIYTSAASFWSRSPTGASEYRNEILHLPYTLDEASKPVIRAVQGNTEELGVVTIKHGQRFTVTWRGGRTPTGVALVAPSSNTHGFNANQRLLMPWFSIDTETKTVTVAVPHNQNLIVRQYYLLYLLNGKTYSVGRWVKLE